MISFIVCLLILIGGYFTYGKFVDNAFGPDDRETPAVAINDGVDYVVMPEWKMFLVQLLNIAGLGPIFGALQGALWGPVVFLWITFGTVFFASGVPEKRANDKIMTTIFILYPLIITCYFLRWLNFDFEFILFEIIYETVCAINILY